MEMKKKEKQVQLLQFSKRLRSDPIFFSEKILGIPLHPGQVQWVTNATKKINILRPGNRWGKTFTEAVLHTWHLMTKTQLTERMFTPEEWLDQPYETLNFGPAYEQAREIPRLMRDMIEGHIMFPKHMHDKWGKTNKSMLKGWAIVDDRIETERLPSLQLMTGGKLLIRSYSDMGSAFKAKSLAFISGDECAEIKELWTFTNVTLLPRVVDMKGMIHFVGTPQPEGHDYMMMIERAQEEMAKEEEHDDFIASLYTQKGTMYDNVYLDKDEIKKTEEIADEALRLQIIEGEYVESGDKYFGYERVANAVDKKLEWLEEGLPGRKYLLSVDFAGGKSQWSDYTVMMVIDYTEEPYTLAHLFRIRGDRMSIPMQYEKVGEILDKFDGKLIIDGSSLGGKNAAAFLRHLSPIVVDITPRNKAEMLQALKHAFDGGRSEKRKRTLKNQDGKLVDMVEEWGLIRYPKNDVLLRELQNYKLDDKKLRQDMVMTLAQAVWWIELRRPKHPRNRMVVIDDWSVI